MQYPHTGTNIVSFLKKKVAEFGLEGKITCVVTDNGILKFKYAENDDNNDDDSEIEQDAPNFRHEESDEESELSDSDEDNLKLNTLEQSTSHHYQT
ncbi:hypothetical protein RclHR1_03890024 [Rhizophagus clarus]|uniref:Uncharacterized protein n=1 Tax=Rhizophagus clarus TaxID=94130 RepID=A0A2Z6S8A7_9GLOM|nr:hypothetical protein RclHR1_03890024 [Rhizophagus clarus]